LPYSRRSRFTVFLHDLTAGAVVSLVAIPLCLGVALASNAPLFSGLLAGIVGGIVVGALSGSQTSVSGPAAGLTAVMAAQLAQLGSFEALLFAVVVAGLLQIILGICRAGFIAAFFPTSVTQGLLAAIGVILILKQIPHILGHDTDPEGEMSFLQPDHETTFSELYALLGDLHPGAATVGIVSILILVLWDKLPFLKKRNIPAPLFVVVLGVGLQWLFQRLGSPWSIESSHLVQVPVAPLWSDLFDFLRAPALSHWNNLAVYQAAVTIATVASLETLLNLEAVDKLDPLQRASPPSRELVAQGIGNVVSGLIGGMPVTSVIVRSSVNINAGGQTKLSTIVHGGLLLVSVVFLPGCLNLIPLSCLAAILFVTGVKLATPAMFRQLWNDGRYQFAPFLVTLIAIVFTDLLIGVLIGLGVSLAFILNSNVRRALRMVVEKHIGGDVLRIELANQVSFLNRASLERSLGEVPRGGHVLLDARGTNYIDPDILSLLRDFKLRTGPARGVQVSLQGFRDRYQLDDEILYVDHTTRDLQDRLTAPQVLRILREGNERFRTGRRLSRDLGRQVQATALGQHPLAVVLSCIDSRTPTELIFDLGLGDIFSVRIAGNVTSPKVLGSLEYGCALAGAKLILVLGHTRCGAVTAAVDLAQTRHGPAVVECEHLEDIVQDIRPSIDAEALHDFRLLSPEQQANRVDAVARRNVQYSVRQIVEQSSTLRGLIDEGRIAVVGAMYDVSTGQIEFITSNGEAVAEEI